MKVITKGMSWTEQEDDFLTKAVKQHGVSKGCLATSNRLKHRTKASCEWHYYNVIAPKQASMVPANTIWSKKEINYLMSRSKGNTTNVDFKAIGKELGRSTKACTSKYYAETVIKPNLTPWFTEAASRRVVKQHPVNNLGTINIHDNGSNHRAEVILRRKDLVVAKYGDLIITLEK